MLNSEILRHAQVLWDYMILHQPLEATDCLLVMGSHDLRVAEHGARLFLDGWAPLMVCCGGLGNQTRNIWKEAEAEKFARIAVEKGVPADKILIENQSTNTGENILLSRGLLQKMGTEPKSFLLVHKPYMERRALATFQKLWPGKKARVSSPPLSMEEYPNKEISMDEMLEIMVGDFQRIAVYARKGYQVEQTIPQAVCHSFEVLVSEGFTGHLLAEAS
jgi:uncharacterized SAM-binding protein YcdF (DUF218 family)